MAAAITARGLPIALNQNVREDRDRAVLLLRTWPEVIV